MRAPRVAVAVSLGLAACAHVPPGRKVDAVTIEGNHAFSDERIVGRLATRPPHGFIVKRRELFDPIVLELDRKRIETFYREQGYFSAKVTDVDVRDGKDGGADVRIEVDEGLPTRIASIEIDRSDLAPGLVPSFPLHEGARFVHPDYLAAKETLRAALVKAGYAFAEVSGTVEVDRDERRAVVKLHIDPGPLVHFGTTKIEGLKRITERAVRARIAWREGDRFDPHAIAITEGQLYQIGEFSVVRIDYEHEGRPAIANLTIHIGEIARHEIRLGFGALVDRTRWEIHARADYTIRGFLFPLATLKLQLIPGYVVVQPSNTYVNAVNGIVAQASAELTKTDFIAPKVKGTATIAYDISPYVGYSIFGPLAALGVQRAFANGKLKLHVGWALRNLSFVNVDPGILPAIETQPWLGYYEQDAILDLRDRPIAARKGFYAGLHMEQGGAFAGGQLSYAMFTPEVRGYVPIISRLVAAARVRAGWIATWANDEVAVTQRYFEGGPDSHRGFAWHRLSPEAVDSQGRLVPIGGEEMFLASAELRVNLFRIARHWFSIVPFIDAGDVTMPGELRLGNLNYAAGLGLRYDTIIGPIRIDAGYRLNRYLPPNPDPNQRVAVSFSLGEAF
jgi:translocation and assembly module TamA